MPEPLNAGPCGTIAMHANDWKRLCGYDERMYGHGLEDGDLTDRAGLQGIKVIREQGDLFHMPHETRLSDAFYPRRRYENAMIREEHGPWHHPKWGQGERHTEARK